MKWCTVFLSYYFLYNFVIYSCFWSQFNSDEWKNFLQRFDCKSDEKLRGELEEELRLWASYRGQTLTKTGTNCFFDLLPLMIFLHIRYVIWCYILHCIIVSVFSAFSLNSHQAKSEEWCIFDKHWNYRLFLIWRRMKVRGERFIEGERVKGGD